MPYDIQQGSDNHGIRAEVVDAMVKQVAARSYKFKQAVAVVPTSAWKNTFFREQIAIPAGQTGNATKGLPRGANFPQYSIGWTEVSVRIVKHGLEENIAWEDIIAGDINVQARTIIRLTEGVVKSVDDDIFLNLTQNGSAIVSYAVVTATHGAWDQTSGAIIDDLMRASRYIAENNYDTSDLMCFVSPKDKQSIMNYIVSKGAQFPTMATGIAENGRIGQLAGITLIESNSVTASWALVVKPKTCATFKQLVPLSSTTIEDPYKSVKIRVVEEGVVELTDPLSVVVLTGTQSI